MSRPPSMLSLRRISRHTKDCGSVKPEMDAAKFKPHAIGHPAKHKLSFWHV